jgi:protein-L-isoaspartate(D-aspartate) O-methyltransferase
MDFAQARLNMVVSQINPQSVTDKALLDALGEVPRERFVPAAQRDIAYMDKAVPLGISASDSQERAMMMPVAFAQLVALAEIKPSDLVLVIGCATGYSAAIIAKLADSVVALETNETLAAQANDTLMDLGIDNAAVVSGPLDKGYVNEAPYDVIFVDGAIDRIDSGLISQLNEGGRLVAILSSNGAGKAHLVLKSGDVASDRISFDANAPKLPDFQAPEVFSF